MILVRTFLVVDKKQNPGFLFLSQTIVSVSFTKERWMQKLSGIPALELLLLFFFNWTFFGVTFWSVGLYLGQGLA